MKFMAWVYNQDAFLRAIELGEMHPTTPFNIYASIKKAYFEMEIDEDVYEKVPHVPGQIKEKISADIKQYLVDLFESDKEIFVWEEGDYEKLEGFAEEVDEMIARAEIQKDFDKSEAEARTSL